MTRQEFIDEAKRRGKSKEETRAKFERLDAEGAFDDSIKPTAPEPAAAPTEQQKPEGGYLAGLGKFFTEDIPGAVGGALERTKSRAERIEAPTTLGGMAERATGATGAAGNLVEGVAGVPERLTRTVAGAVGTIGEAPGVAMELGGKAINRLAGGVPGKLLKPLVEGVAQSGPVQAVAQKVSEMPESEQANLGAAVDLLDAFGMKGDDAARAVGKATEGAGKRFLGGEMKIKDTLAKRGYGKTIDIKKKNLLNNISKYDLESTTGNFSKMAAKADDMAISRVNKADDLIAQAAKAIPQESFVDDVLGRGIDFVDDAAALGKGDQAEAIIEKISQDAVAKGMTGKQTVETLVAFKRRLDPDGNLFKLGPALNDADNLERSIRKKLYLEAVSKINEVVPDAAKLNREAKELWDITNIAADAASRTGNRYGVSLSDAIAGTGGMTAAMMTRSPELAAGTLALLAGNKLIGQGRGAAALIEAGKGMQGLGRTAAPSFLGAGAGSMLGRKTFEEEEANRPDLSVIGNTGFRR